MTNMPHTLSAEDDGNEKPEIPEVNTPTSPMGWYSRTNMLMIATASLPQQNLALGFQELIGYLEGEGYTPGGGPLLLNVDDVIDVFIQSAVSGKYVPHNPKAQAGVNHGLNARLKGLPSDQLASLVTLIATGDTTGQSIENPDPKSQLLDAAIAIHNIPTIAEEDKNIGRS